MIILARLVVTVLLAVVLSAGLEDCQPCEDPSQLFCSE
jgi:hypothetical protein